MNGSVIAGSRPATPPEPVKKRKDGNEPDCATDDPVVDDEAQIVVMRFSGANELSPRNIGGRSSTLAYPEVVLRNRPQARPQHRAPLGVQTDSSHPRLVAAEESFIQERNSVDQLPQQESAAGKEDQSANGVTTATITEHQKREHDRRSRASNS